MRARLIGVMTLALAVAASPACGPSLSDCAHCKADEFCAVGYRYCNETQPVTVVCRARPSACAATAAACSDAGTCLAALKGTPALAPVFQACTVDADAGTIVASWCD